MPRRSADRGFRRRSEIMGNGQQDRLTELSRRVAAGEYEVDPTVVADAIVLRMRRAANQIECSYPASVADPSMNRSPAVPAPTRPIQVIATCVLGRLASALSILARADSGAQTHNS